MIYGNYLKFGAGGGGTAISTAKLMKTGQTTSYRTGDDGDLEAGRNADFFTLAENNPFGNTNRFTDLVGTQTYDDGVVIDWSTFNGTDALMFAIDMQATGNVTWEDAFLYIEGLTLAGFSDWRMPNNNEGDILYYHEQDLPFDYPPFNDSLGVTYWTSTTVKAYGLTGFARVIRRDGQAYADKTGAGGRALPVRNVTLTELGL